MTGIHAKVERERGEMNLRIIEAYAGRLERIIENVAASLDNARHAAQGRCPIARRMLREMKEAR